MDDDGPGRRRRETPPETPWPRRAERDHAPAAPPQERPGPRSSARHADAVADDPHLPVTPGPVSGTGRHTYQPRVPDAGGRAHSEPLAGPRNGARRAAEQQRPDRRGPEGRAPELRGAAPPRNRTPERERSPADRPGHRQRDPEDAGDAHRGRPTGPRSTGAPVPAAPREPVTGDRPEGPRSRPARAESARAAPPRVEPPTRPVPRTASRDRSLPTVTATKGTASAAGPATEAAPGRSATAGAARASVAAPAEPAAAPAGRAATRAGRTAGLTARSPRSLGSALLATLAATVVPGTGHLMLRRRRTGGLILAVFLLAVVALTTVVLTAGRTALIENLLSTRVLVTTTIGLVVAALAWMAVIVRTYQIARPRGLDTGRQTVGVLVVTALCLGIAAPMGFAANLANSQRTLLDGLFGGSGGTAAAEAIAKPRLNILLVGSDAGPDRTGARTDTMMMASIDTRTARTTLFSLPRNIGYARFPPGSPMADKFPTGFHDPNGNALSGDYLLNAVYAWGLEHPTEAPTTPTTNPGLNLLHQTVAYMLGVQLDYYVEVNMAAFASIIDALGGVTIDVGPIPLPIGGVLPNGRHVKPDGYVPAGVQKLDGEQALWFARSRRDSDDYSRMGRQRCLLQTILKEKSPTDVLTHFQQIASATTNSVATNIPQQVLPALVSLAGNKTVTLDSVSFDPKLADPSERDGRFNTSHVDVGYMRKVVQAAVTAPPPVPASAAAAVEPRSAATDDASPSATPPPTSAAPESLATSCT